MRSPAMTTACVALVIATLASCAPELAHGADAIKLKNLRDDFTTSAVNRCEACVAITHAEMMHIEHVKSTRLVVSGTKTVESGDIQVSELCSSAFGGHRKYGFRMVNDVKRLVGPGLNMFDFIEGAVSDRVSVERQLKTRCDALMYTLDDFDVVETRNEAYEEAVKNSTDDATEAQKLSAMFMKLIKKNCVEHTNECESVDSFISSVQDDVNKLHETVEDAKRELVNKTADDDDKRVNVTIAKAMCNEHTLSDVACSFLSSELLSAGKAQIQRWHNYTGEAHKYSVRVAAAYDTAPDENDVDFDGDKEELLVEAMLNITSLRANYSMLSAELNFETTLAIKPGYHVAVHNLAYAYKDGEKFTEARDMLKPALDESKAEGLDTVTLAESWKLMCEIEHKLDNTESAIEACKKAIALDDRNFDALRLLAQLHMVNFFTELHDIRSMDNTTHGIADRQRDLSVPLAQAKILFTSALTLDPVKNEIAQLGMVLYFEQAAEEAALQLFTREQIGALMKARHTCANTDLGVDGVCSDMLELAANHLLKMGFIAIGSDALQMSLVLDGSRVHVWRNLGFSYMHNGNFKAAEVAFDNAKKLDKTFKIDESIQALFERGLEFEKKIETDQVTTKWSEPRRPNKSERDELQAQLLAKLSTLSRSHAPHDEL